MNLKIACMIICCCAINAHAQNNPGMRHTLTDTSIRKVLGSLVFDNSVFVLTCDDHNLTDPFLPPVNYDPRIQYYQSVVINNTNCNDNPNAIIVVTPLGFTSSFGVFYDGAIRRWKITIGAEGMDRTNCYALGTPKGGECGAYYVSVMPYKPLCLKRGDKFNVMIVSNQK